MASVLSASLESCALVLHPTVASDFAVRPSDHSSNLLQKTPPLKSISPGGRSTTAEHIDRVTWALPHSLPLDLLCPISTARRAPLRTEPLAFMVPLPPCQVPLYAELGHFFQQLCARTLKLDVLRQMKYNIPIVICKLEKICAHPYCLM
jgi:hypothetical protein